ncbi:heme NO-binding domain-containing protein [Thiomicrorhabdus sediminis]|uniref:heme NO-binding domain-containing protein n=1 Tax=Thiomicrorhabdus sediminis TaxID=2580412 RepID=UPI00143D4348|nr:heme NO-binding domain-containing protein [Thiomicrorhabdus sediminis]
MRGVIFTTFNEFVENEFGYETLDYILLQGEFPNDGGFCAGETYNPAVLVEMLQHLSAKTDIEMNSLWYKYGFYAFTSLVTQFREIYDDKESPIFNDNVFDFVEQLNIMHFTELKKIYPNAQFPRFGIEREDDQITLIYSSEMKLHHFVKGLLSGCIHFFDEPLELSMTINDDPQNTFSKFTIKRR